MGFPSYFQPSVVLATGFPSHSTHELIILFLHPKIKTPFRAIFYRLLHLGDFLAFLRPYLRLSLTRGSRVKKPALRSFFLKFASNNISDRASPCLIASAWSA